MLDLDAELPGHPRPLPRKIPPGSHILSHSDLKAIAKHFAGRDDVRLGEELIPHILHHGMLGADSGRIIPKEILTELGNGHHHAGRLVLQRFISNLRRQPAHMRSGGAVKLDKDQAGYEPSGDENRICVLCSMWRDDHQCSLVAGHIDRTGTCNHFERPAHYQRGGAVDADDHLDLAPELLGRAHQTGKQLGSNPGGTFSGFPDGIDRYVKVPKHEDQARQEVLANRLYQAVGVPVAHAELTRLGDRVAVASHIVPDAKPLKDQRPGAVPELLEHFPADAWLANWDAVGGRKDNILLDGNHSAWRVDQGGALSYKPKGKPKGSAFGNTVEETKTLLDPRYRSSEVFHGVELDPRNETAQRIAQLPDWQIRDLVHRYLGENDGYGPRGLADKLIARRDDLAKQYRISPQ